MRKKTKGFIFISLAVLFFTFSPLAIFYALGWRFDWKTKNIFEPGVLYFKISPKNSQIYLNSQFKKKTDFFFGSAIIENLPPKTYEVQIKKEGFHEWKKNLEIGKRQVTELKNVVLIPKDPPFETISVNTEDFFVSEDGKKVILKEKNNANNQSSGWSLKLFELDKNVKSHLVNDQDFASLNRIKGAKPSQKINIELFYLKFSSDSKKILLGAVMQEQLKYYVLELEKSPSFLIPVIIFDENPQDIFFDPQDSQKIFVFKEGVLKKQDISEANRNAKLKISIENIVTFLISKQNIYYIDSFGFVFKSDLSLNQKEQLNESPISIKKEAGYQIASKDSRIILKEGENIYVFNKEKKEFQKFFEKVSSFEFSPDSEKIALLSDSGVWVLFLEKQYSQPQKEAGEKLQILNSLEKIDQISWYNNHYLILRTGEKIRVAEIDDRDKINIVDLSSFKNPKIFWGQEQKTLYVLTEANLRVFKNLIP